MGEHSSPINGQMNKKSVLHWIASIPMIVLTIITWILIIPIIAVIGGAVLMIAMLNLPAHWLKGGGGE